MDDLPRQQLGELLGRYGRGLIDDPRRLEALLRDVCPQQRREVSVLAGAARERVPADLLSSSQGVPKAALVARLQQRLEDNLGLAPDAARWGVETWGLTLGVLSDADLQALPRTGSAAPNPQSPPPLGAPATRPPATVSEGQGRAPAPRPVTPSRPSVGNPVPGRVPTRPGGNPPGAPGSAVRGTQAPVAAPTAAGAAAGSRRSGGGLAALGIIAAIAVVVVVIVAIANRKGGTGTKSGLITASPPAPCYTGTTPPAPRLGASSGNPIGPCNPSGSSSGQGGTSGSGAPQVSPQALYQQLLQASFGPNEVPSGFAVRSVASMALNSSEMRMHAVGSVNIVFDHTPDSANLTMVRYVVYPTDADAQADYNAARAGPVIGGSVTGSFDPSGILSVPSVCQTGTYPVQQAQATVPSAGCLLRSSNTVILIFTARQSDPATVASEASAFASDALLHLQRVGTGG